MEQAVDKARQAQGSEEQHLRLARYQIALQSSREDIKRLASAFQITDSVSRSSLTKMSQALTSEKLALHSERQKVKELKLLLATETLARQDSVEKLVAYDEALSEARGQVRANSLLADQSLSNTSQHMIERDADRQALARSKDALEHERSEIVGLQRELAEAVQALGKAERLAEIRSAALEGERARSVKIADELANERTQLEALRLSFNGQRAQISPVNAINAEKPRTKAASSLRKVKRSAEPVRNSRPVVNLLPLSLLPTQPPLP